MQEVIRKTITMTPDNDINVEKKYLSGILSLLFSVLLTFLLLLVISKNYIFSIDINKDAKLFTTDYRFLSLVAPEPMERVLFTTGIIIMPVLLLIFYSAFINLTSRIKNLTFLSKAYDAFYLGTIVMISFLGYIGIKKHPDIYSRYNVGINPISLAFVSIAASFLYYALTNPDKTALKDSSIRILQSAFNLLSIVLILSVFLLCIFSINSVTDSSTFRDDFNAVFHAVVQVYLGKELLVDLTHQYGLYPHFIEPLLKIVGLSLLSFTALMGILMLISLFLIHQFLIEITSDRIIGHIGFIVMIYYGYILAQLAYDHDFTFQYFPIRFFFPALSIYLTYNYFKKKAKAVYYLLFAVYSIAVLWNFDTGFVVFASWLLVLLFQELFTLDIKKMLNHILTAMFIFLGILLLFTLYMYIRYGHIPEYAKFFTYQKMFYIYGFGMMPMPILHPWNLVLLVYTIGLLYSFTFLMEKKESIKAKIVFFLSILGTGIFAYYQGRSHDLNLLHVSYPAIIILTILTDCLLQHVREGGLKFDKLAIAVILFFMLYSASSLASNYPIIFRMIITQMHDIESGEPKNVAQNVAFIKGNLPKGEKVLVMSDHSGIYYLELGMASPINVPSPVETFLLEDTKKINAYIMSSNLCKEIIIDKITFFGLNDTIATYLDSNFIPFKSPNEDIAIYIRK